MLAFLTILAATLAGYAGVEPWAIAAAAMGLASISYTQNQKLYERGNALGFSQIVESTLLRSLLNAFVASGAGYGLGLMVRLL